MPLAQERGLTTVVPGVGGASWGGFAPSIIITLPIVVPVGGATWAGFAPTAAGVPHDGLLLETGVDDLLLETGDRLLLEQHEV